MIETKEKKEVTEMGLEIEVVDSERDVNLAEFYAILDAVKDSFNWHLTGDRRHTYNILSGQVQRLTKSSVVDAFKNKPTELNSCEKRDLEYLERIPEDSFNKNISLIGKTVAEFNDDDTHLWFDYEKCPETELDWSTSWTLRTILCRCESSNSKPHHDYVVELDTKKVVKVAKTWRRIGLKLTIAKWIGYFNEGAAQNMADDMADDLNVNDNCIDLYDLIRFRNFFLKILKKHNKNKRMWLISSY